MKIYTKTGDKGKTSLLGEGRVSKDDLKVEAYGNVDELNSWIGYILSSIDVQRNELQEIQNKLFVIGSWLSLVKKRDAELYKIAEITKYDINYLEINIDLMTESLDPLTNFILPGGSDLISKIHIARCVCRRAERGVIRYGEEDKFIVAYLNRLSDYLFTLSRYVAKVNNVEEIIWTSTN